MTAKDLDVNYVRIKNEVADMVERQLAVMAANSELARKIIIKGDG